MDEPRPASFLTNHRSSKLAVKFKTISSSLQERTQNFLKNFLHIYVSVASFENWNQKCTKNWMYISAEANIFPKMQQKYSKNSNCRNFQSIQKRIINAIWCHRDNLRLHFLLFNLTFAKVTSKYHQNKHFAFKNLH